MYTALTNKTETVKQVKMKDGTRTHADCISERKTYRGLKVSTDDGLHQLLLAFGTGFS